MYDKLNWKPPSVGDIMVMQDLGVYGKLFSAKHSCWQKIRVNGELMESVR